MGNRKDSVKKAAIEKTKPEDDKEPAVQQDNGWNSIHFQMFQFQFIFQMEFIIFFPQLESLDGWVAKKVNIYS